MSLHVAAYASPSNESSPSAVVAAQLPQQILNFVLEHKLMGGFSLISVEPAKSAQQEVFLLQMDVKNTKVRIDQEWDDCLKTGKNRLVVRIWKGGSNWWNLNSNQDPRVLSRSETMGYKIAHESFVANDTSDVLVPRVLHYESGDGQSSLHFAWAVLEYVGPHSMKFERDEMLFDASYLEGMVKVRHEFGFDEPHPRWGRVPEGESLKYATVILKQIVLPLQRQSRKWTSDREEYNLEVKTYSRMIQLYSGLWKDMSSTINYRSATTPTDIPSPTLDQRMVHALKIVEEAVTKTLPINDASTHIPPMSPVLVHLDLQPQNVLFCKKDMDAIIVVSSVLDWEDAAMADPRFEILLLCRKVCPNRLQANQLWKLYSDSIAENPGPIRPWLQLETIHSIITLLLQSMELHNGGRNPWETKTDLWGKLQREFFRWNEMLEED